MGRAALQSLDGGEPLYAVNSFGEGDFGIGFAIVWIENHELAGLWASQIGAIAVRREGEFSHCRASLGLAGLFQVIQIN